MLLFQINQIYIFFIIFLPTQISLRIFFFLLTWILFSQLLQYKSVLLWKKHQLLRQWPKLSLAFFGTQFKDIWEFSEMICLICMLLSHSLLYFQIPNSSAHSAHSAIFYCQLKYLAGCLSGWQAEKENNWSFWKKKSKVLGKFCMNCKIHWFLKVSQNYSNLDFI